VLKYARLGKKPNKRPQSVVSSWNLMLRALKTTIIEQLEELRSGTEWTTSVTHLVLRNHLIQMLRDHHKQIEHARMEALLKFAEHRMMLLWRTDLFLHIKKGTHPQWSVLDRRDSEHIDGIDVFASPDIVVRIQSKWNLIRLDMQASPSSEQERMEALVMVLWSVQRAGLPSTFGQFIVQTMGWRKGGWMIHRTPVTQKEVETAFQMVRKDTMAMSECAKVAEYSIASLPLARNEASCRRCSFQNRCLGGSSLAEKKQRRVEGLSGEVQ
jgi:hypothetical protein